MAEVVSLAEAVEQVVHDGDTVAFEGFTHLIPFAAVHELLRQGRRGLTLVRMTPDLIHDQPSCFVGIGLPSTAANLARRTHAPELVLIYESGCIGAKPTALPLSIGDGVLAVIRTQPGIEVERVRAATGWPLAVAPEVWALEPPTAHEHRTLRELLATQQPDAAKTARIPSAT